MSDRATLLTKTAKVLKKHYKPVSPPSNRSVLEHLLYACCLEASHHQPSDDAFARLQETYFDLNEVRVTTVSELAEVMSGLNDPEKASRRLKKALQAVFEAHYSFDIDALKKGNLGKAVKEIESLNGVSPFAVSYVSQNALSGHSIPANKGVFDLFIVLGVITEAEAAKKRIPGLERTIPKSKGVEFGSLLHQFGVDFMTSPYSPRVRSIVLEIEPGAKDRLPKRAPKPAPKKKAAKSKTAKPKQAAKKKTAAASGTKKSAAAAKKSATKRLARKKPR
jgi:endonuclease-3